MPEACGLCDGATLVPFRRGIPDRRHWLGGPRDLVRCAACGLVQTSPRPTEEELGQAYPPGYVSFCGNGRRAGTLGRELVRLPYTLRYGRVRDAEPGRGRLLDVGCGTGGYLAEMAELGWEPWGVEPAEAAAREARRRLALPAERVVVAVAEEAELPAASFELVTLSHVLEHVRDPLGVLRRVHGWLVPGGRVRIWLPNVESLEARAFGRLWFGLDLPRHLWHFSPATIGLALERAGFRVRRVVPQFGASSLTGSLRQSADALRGRRRDYRDAPRLTRALLPLYGVTLALGNAPALDVTAERR